MPVDPRGTEVYHGSMVRPAITFLTIAAIICCPLNCAGVSIAADLQDSGDSLVARSVAGPRCACCQSRQAAKVSARGENSAPLQSPPVDGVGGSCLCHGAVLKGDGPGDLGLALLLVNGLAGTDSALMPGESATLTACRDFYSGEDPLLKRGREICILHQSLLL